ncbi:MAG: DUF4190 domain-containing protein [Akkermansia sp.]|nr:DUF4190 domain-containing protein [Akkermansia sp.]
MSEPSSIPNSVPTIPATPPSNALAIWALVIGLLCCAPAGIVMGIIGLNKYPQGSSGKTISIVALVLSILGVVANIVLYLTQPDLYSGL